MSFASYCLICFYKRTCLTGSLVLLLISSAQPNVFLLYRKVISLFYVCINLALLCVVIFLQPFHAGFIFLVVLIMLPVENGACPQRVHSWLEDKTPRLEVQTWRIFQACTLSQLSQTGNRNLLGNIHPAQNPTLFFIHFAAVCSPFKLCLWGFGDSLCMAYFYGTAIWRLSKCQGHLSWSSYATCLLCGEKEQHRPILHFMTYCVKGVPRQTGGSPNVRSSWTRLAKLEAPSPVL